jgi:hypothetical protein
MSDRNSPLDPEVRAVAAAQRHATDFARQQHPF